MKILVVDDSSIVRKIIREAADVLEMETIEAIDGIEGLEKIEESYEEIELILLDWNMPRMNGIEFLRFIKKDERYNGIPVMMVTTEGEKENIVQAIKAGASNYLIKPFSMEELQKRILECLGEGFL